MSLLADLEKEGSTVVAELQKLAAVFTKAKAFWNAINSTQTRSVIAKVSADVLKIVADGTAAVTEKGVNIQMDLQVYNDVKQLLVDAKSDGVIKTDLALLGIKL